MAEERVSIGAARGIPTAAKNIRPGNPGGIVDVSVLLKRPQRPPPSRAAPLSREDFASRYGATPASVEKVREFATAHGLTVKSADPAQGIVVLSGPVSQINRAFAVELSSFEIGGKTYRSHSQVPTMPAALRDAVDGVVGLDDLPIARPH